MNISDRLQEFFELREVDITDPKQMESWIGDFSPAQQNALAELLEDNWHWFSDQYERAGGRYSLYDTIFPRSKKDYWPIHKLIEKVKRGTLEQQEKAKIDAMSWKDLCRALLSAQEVYKADCSEDNERALYKLIVTWRSKLVSAVMACDWSIVRQAWRMSPEEAEKALTYDFWLSADWDRIMESCLIGDDDKASELVKALIARRNNVLKLDLQVTASKNESSTLRRLKRIQESKGKD